MSSISYAVLVKDEYLQFKKLVDDIFLYKDEEDELVVVMDNPTQDVYNYITSFNFRTDVTISEHNLNGDFATHKNYLFSLCKNDYIVNLDADEHVHPEFFENIKDVMEKYSNVDVFLLPRVNTVSGITEEDIKKWGWHKDVFGRINYPDWQRRITKNRVGIHWVNKVHETLNGQKSYATLDYDAFNIYHFKDIEKQRKQNELYDKIILES